MPGPAKRPSHLKAIAGTARPDRVEAPGVVIPLLDSTPEPVDWLPNAHAVTEWRRLAPLLVVNRMIGAADLSTFGHLCALHGKMVQLWAAGEAPTGHMVAQYNAIASAFGLAPAWRGKVKPIDEKGKGNKFAALKAEED